MTPARCYRFDDFTLDAANRSLLRGGVPVALNARYFDALALLVREHGQLVSKQRFFDEVWGNTVVTDAALTQCIKEIRRQLGDEAGDPRFVRTVPGHGYCFIAPVSDSHEREPHARANAGARELAATTDLAEGTGLAIADAAPAAAAAEGSGQAGQPPAFTRWLLGGAAATLGGAVAGLVGGLLYGSALAFSPNSKASVRYRCCWCCWRCTCWWASPARWASALASRPAASPETAPAGWLPAAPWAA